MISEQHPHYERPEFRCSFCGIASEEVEVLIAAPNNDFICSNCVEKYYPSPPAESLFVPKKRKKKNQSLLDMLSNWLRPAFETYVPRPYCSFCGRHYENCTYLVVSYQSTFICDSCLKICVQELVKFREKI